jgi:hypothetical protein
MLVAASDTSLAQPDVCHRTSADRTRGRAGSERAPFRRGLRHRADYEGVLQDEVTRPKGVRDCAVVAKLDFAFCWAGVRTHVHSAALRLSGNVCRAPIRANSRL